MSIEKKLKLWKNFKQELPHRFSPYKKRNWGNPVHSLCSFQGKMKPSLAYHLVKIFSSKGDFILDPFSGSGTTLLESSINGRNSIGFDISKIAVSISQGKINNYDLDIVNKILYDLEQYINSKNKITKKTLDDLNSVAFNKNIQDYYEKDTLSEILKSRDFFMKNLNLQSADWCLVFSSMLHIVDHIAR